MGNDVISWIFFENATSSEVLIRFGASSDQGTYTSFTIGLAGVNYNETITRSSASGIVTTTTSGGLGPISIDDSGVISLTRGGSYGPARAAVSIDSTGTVTGQVGAGLGIDTGLIELDAETGDYYVLDLFGTLLAMPMSSVYAVAAHARSRVDAAIANASGFCFPAHTPVAISLTETRPISDIRVGDTVLAFDPSAELGRGALVPRKVVRLYRNMTDEWVKLTWIEGGEQKELFATPGHHFLDRFGRFPTIEEMLENGKATVILASGELTEVTAERITCIVDTARLINQAQDEVNNNRFAFECRRSFADVGKNSLRAKYGIDSPPPPHNSKQHGKHGLKG